MPGLSARSPRCPGLCPNSWIWETRVKGPSEEPKRMSVYCAKLGNCISGLSTSCSKSKQRNCSWRASGGTGNVNPENGLPQRVQGSQTGYATPTFSLCVCPYLFCPNRTFSSHAPPWLSTPPALHMHTQAHTGSQSSSCSQKKGKPTKIQGPAMN
jgi:hypothetical protein